MSNNKNKEIPEKKEYNFENDEEIDSLLFKAYVIKHYKDNIGDLYIDEEILNEEEEEYIPLNGNKEKIEETRTKKKESNEETPTDIIIVDKNNNEEVEDFFGDDLSESEREEEFMAIPIKENDEFSVYACDGNCFSNSLLYDRYHCTECEDFDYCDYCYKIDRSDPKHGINGKHKMECIDQSDYTEIRKFNKTSLQDLCILSLIDNEIEKKNPTFDFINFLPEDIKSYIEINFFEIELIKKLKDIINWLPKELNILGASHQELQNLKKKIKFTDIPISMRIYLKMINSLDFQYDFNFLPIGSVNDLIEQYFYNDTILPLYEDLCYYPIKQIDYDFCFDVLNIKNGEIYQIDNECSTYQVIATSIGY
eukprot:TRINITY_DN10941_c0_g1_i1.p1 TRINITY_DN10941_c0_g1~~TRINITY_DN10941_c0_g1_i1.p1  ORF type:complete len:418 (-),score=138.80 TRINITY_DN10941_c0_g1_i1:80-1177(-)